MLSGGAWLPDEPGAQSFRLPLAVARLRAPAQKAVAGEPGWVDRRASALRAVGCRLTQAPAASFALLLSLALQEALIRWL